MTTFPSEIQSAVLAHMNGDHADDSLLLVRAFAHADASAARMSGFDEHGGNWTATVGGEEVAVRMPWPAGQITERREVRREIVALYDAACERLGIQPRPH
jgi:hypothetical protein